mmetsp:Transcript_16633/g.15935  ORF Transcript_16633/g.15935 Transcript_16633/m.15935 type:complete len:195 (-) Transcript_16633:1149-1733(-)
MRPGLIFLMSLSPFLVLFLRLLRAFHLFIFFSLLVFVLAFLVSFSLVLPWTLISTLVKGDQSLILHLPSLLFLNVQRIVLIYFKLDDGAEEFFRPIDLVGHILNVNSVSILFHVVLEELYHLLLGVHGSTDGPYLDLRPAKLHQHIVEVASTLLDVTFRLDSHLPILKFVPPLHIVLDSFDDGSPMVVEAFMFF